MQIKKKLMDNRGHYDVEIKGWMQKGGGGHYDVQMLHIICVPNSCNFCPFYRLRICFFLACILFGN